MQNQTKYLLLRCEHPNEEKTMTQLALQPHYDFYVKHEDELVSKFGGMYIVISDAMSVHSFADDPEAYDFGVKNFGAGHFLLHKCMAGGLDVVQTANCAF